MAWTMTKATLRQGANLANLPTDLTFECRMAVAGHGPRAADWADKPHRIVYDLCAEIERLAAKNAE